jgi:hypothetical protein
MVLLVKNIYFIIFETFNGWVSTYGLDAFVMVVYIQLYNKGYCSNINAKSTGELTLLIHPFLGFAGLPNPFVNIIW